MLTKISEILAFISLKRVRTRFISKGRENTVNILVCLEGKSLSFLIDLSAVNITDDVTTPLRHDEEETSSIEGNNFLMEDMNSDHKLHDL